MKETIEKEQQLELIGPQNIGKLKDKQQKVHVPKVL